MFVWLLLVLLLLLLQLSLMHIGGARARDRGGEPQNDRPDHHTGPLPHRLAPARRRAGGYGAAGRAGGCEKRHLFLSVSYVCPEPVLAK